MTRLGGVFPTLNYAVKTSEALSRVAHLTSSNDRGGKGERRHINGGNIQYVTYHQCAINLSSNHEFYALAMCVFVL